MFDKSYELPWDLKELSYDEALCELKSALRFGIVPLLETVIDMLAELGNPDDYFSSVQIAGTNGKTSTSRYTAAILHGEGLKVGLYTSPHVLCINERMEINGQLISDEQLAHGLSAAFSAATRLNARRVAQGLTPYDVTEFDLLTVAALVIFAEAQVDVVVLECGLGGRWDATSATRNISAVAITGIGLDHMRILGDTEEKIAGEKAAIIKPGRCCVLSTSLYGHAEACEVMLKSCNDASTEPLWAEFSLVHPNSRLGGALELTVPGLYANYHELAALKPNYQAANIATAVRLAEAYMGRALNSEKLYYSIVRCPTPGRFQTLRPDPLILVDACHNPQSIESFLASLDDISPDVKKRPAALIASLADKDYRSMLKMIIRAFPRIYVTQTQSPRALSAYDLAQALQEELNEAKAASSAGRMAPCSADAPSAADSTCTADADFELAEFAGSFASVKEAAAALDHESYMAFGSITLVGELEAALKAELRV